MSDESYEYKRGIERGKNGAGEPYGLLEIDILASKKERNARERGYEPGSDDE